MLFIKRKLDGGGADSGSAAASTAPAEPVTIEGEVVVADAAPSAPPPVVRKQLFGKKAKAEPAGQSAPEPSKKAKSLLGMFGKDAAPAKKKASAPLDAPKAERAEQSAPQPSKKAKGLFGMLGKSSGTDREKAAATVEDVKPVVTEAQQPPAAEAKPSKASRKEKRAAKAEPRKRKPARPRGNKPAYLGVTLDGTGDAVWWEITGGALKRLAEPPTSGTAIVFSRDDTRIASERALNHQDAVGLAFQEMGEDAAVANASKAYGVVYATAASRIAESPVKVIPGLLVLEAIAKANNLAAPNVVGFDLASAEGGTALLVLAGLHAKDGLGKHQLTLNPENRQFSLDQFVAQQKGAQGGVTLFGLAELLAIAAAVPGYPAEPLVLWGVPKSKAWLGAVTLSGLLAAAAVGLYVYTESATMLMKHQADEAKKAEKVAQAAAARFAESRVGGLIAKASLDTAQAFSDASALWVPRSTVSMEADLSGGNALTVTFSPSGPRGMKEYVFPAEPAEIRSFIGRTHVGNCTRSELSINGATNEITAVYQCPNAGSPVPGYGLD